MSRKGRRKERREKQLTLWEFKRTIEIERV